MSGFSHEPCFPQALRWLKSFFVAEATPTVQATVFSIIISSEAEGFASQVAPCEISPFGRNDTTPPQ